MNSEEIKNIPIHFIVGSARSGTTLLSTIFSQHSEIISTTENDFLLYFLHDFIHADFSDVAVRKKLLKYFKTKGKRVINIWDAHPEFIESFIYKNDGIGTYQEFCKLVYLDHGERRLKKNGAKFIIDKNPFYTIHVEKLLACFPDSKFIALVRDYRDVISSQKKFFSLLKLIPVFGYLWNNNNELLYECLKKYPDKFLLVKYEDLVLSPQESIERICNFLSISFEPQMMNYHQHLDLVYKQLLENLSPTQKKRVADMFSLIAQPVSKERIGASKKELNPKELVMADFVSGKTGSKFGYFPQNEFNIWQKIYFHLLTFPILLISAFQIRMFNYHYYYLPIRVRKLAELFNIPLMLKRIVLGHKKGLGAP